MGVFYYFLLEMAASYIVNEICIVFHFLALHFIFWHCISFFGTAFHFLALHFIFWHCISFFGTACISYFGTAFRKNCTALSRQSELRIFTCTLLRSVINAVSSLINLKSLSANCVERGVHPSAASQNNKKQFNLFFFYILENTCMQKPSPC